MVGKEHEWKMKTTIKYKIFWILKNLEYTRKGNKKKIPESDHKRADYCRGGAWGKIVYDTKASKETKKK